MEVTASSNRSKTIGLCMIVKNEAHVIERCLESLRSLVDYVLIEDTGSTDGTQSLAREWLDQTGMSGEVYEEPWRDFAYNRSHVLARLRRRDDIDYAFVMDADDQVRVEAGFDAEAFRRGLDKDWYKVALRNGVFHYERFQICDNRKDFRYRGVLHEFMELSSGSASSGTAIGFHILSGREGARNKDPDKYRKDADILETALRTEQDLFLRSRYTYYLAQSYRDAGEMDKALDSYLRRAELGFWVDEVFLSLHGAAGIMEHMGRPFDEVISMYSRATSAAPHRAEALHAASRFCRLRKRFSEGFEHARRGLEIAYPTGGLFVDSDVYDWRLLDEFAINAYWAGHYHGCREACQRLLSEGKVPENTRGRIEENLAFANAALTAKPDAEEREPVVGVPASRRLAVVTPYFKEDEIFLKRCLESVRRQTLPADHFVIADGFPQAWVSEAGVRHVQLDKAHADYGGTPRAIGCLLAISEGYDAIALLDADNWFEPDHMEHCIDAARHAQDGICDYVIARSRIVRPDGTPMDVPTQDIEQHVDTNCFVFLRGAFHALPIWALMPKEASTVGDRFFYQALRELKLRRVVATRITVNYTSQWEVHYRMLGETPPHEAKPNVGGRQITNWLNGLSPRDMEIAERLMRISLREEEVATNRNPKSPSKVIVSFYMANIPVELVNMQRRVLEKFAGTEFSISQIKTDRSHADSVDDFMRETEFDIVVIMDIDCIPLHADALPELVAHAEAGGLAGCVQRANHIENGQHLYVGPFCMALSRRLWAEIGRPSFRPTERGDVGEEITYACEAQGKRIHMIWPSSVDEPIWELTRNVRFGFNTEYGQAFFHGFGIRHDSNRKRFMERGGELVAS